MNFMKWTLVFTLLTALILSSHLLFSPHETHPPAKQAAPETSVFAEESKPLFEQDQTPKIKTPQKVSKQQRTTVAPPSPQSSLETETKEAADTIKELEEQKEEIERDIASINDVQLKKELLETNQLLHNALMDEDVLDSSEDIGNGDHLSPTHLQEALSDAEDDEEELY